MTPRNTVAKGFIAELDGLRGIAILMVMVHRFWPRTAHGTAADVAGAGWIGVDLFFVISGFLIAGILLDTRGEKGYFRNFYARRALRIFPLFYLFVGGVWLVLGRSPEFREHAGSPLWYFLHLGNVPEGVFGLEVPYWLAPVWSLAIEEQFYWSFPLFVAALDRRRLAIGLVALIVIAPVIRLVTTLAFPDQERVQYLVTFCRLDTLAVGCLLAVIVRAVDLERWRDLIRWTCWMVLPVVIALGVASGLDRTSPFDRVLGYSMVAVGCASLLALVILARGQRATALLRLAPLRYFGKLCFGLYLLHRPADTIVTALARRANLDHDLWLLPAKIAVALAFATLSWRLLEQPFLSLKDRFRSERHPGDADTVARPSGLTRLLRSVGILSLLVLVACPGAGIAPSDGSRGDGSRGDGSRGDGAAVDARGDGSNPDGLVGDGMLDAASDASTDAGVVEPTVLYVEGSTHSPITQAIVTRLQAIAASSSRAPQVFAKAGDSITVAADFLHCFDGGTIDLGSHGSLASTIAYFLGGNAAGTSPFNRNSYAAEGGTTAKDAMTGNPTPFAREVGAIDSQISVIMFGTNELRLGWSYDEAGKHMWELVDDSIVRGVVPILSTIPPNLDESTVDARIPTYNRIIRAIAQGRGIPLVDFHRELEALPNRGISADNIHPSTAPGGGCILTSAGLQYGYNVRNLISVEALARTHAALGGAASTTSAPTRVGAGTAANPFVASLPLVDLADTRRGALAITAAVCGGASSGHEIVYQLDLPSAVSVDAWVVDPDGVDVAVHLLAGATCAGSSSSHATGVIGPGTARIVVDAPVMTNDGEYVLVVELR